MANGPNENPSVDEMRTDAVNDLTSLLNEKKKDQITEKEGIALIEFRKWLSSEEFDDTFLDWDKEFKDKQKDPEFKQPWKEFLHEKAGEWVKREIERREKEIEELKKQLSTIPGALHMAPDVVEKLKKDNEKLAKVIQGNLDEIKAGKVEGKEPDFTKLNFPEDLSVEERVIATELTRAIYLIDSAGTKGGIKENENRSVLSDWYREREQPAHAKKIIDFEKALEEEALRVLGSEEEARAFKDRVVLHYASNAKKREELAAEVDHLKLTESVHELGADRFEEFWNVSRAKDDGRALQEFFNKNQKDLGENLKEYQEKRKTRDLHLKSLDETIKDTHPTLIADLEKKVKKLPLDEAEKKIMLDHLDGNPISGRQLIELDEKNPDVGKKILTIMKEKTEDQSIAVEKQSDQYQIIIESKKAHTQMRLSLEDSDPEKKGFEGLKLDMFGTALSPFPVTVENFKEVNEASMLYLLLKEKIPHTLPEILQFREGEEKISTNSFDRLRKIIWSQERKGEKVVENGQVEMTEKKTLEAIRAMARETEAEKAATPPQSTEQSTETERRIFMKYFPGIIF